MFMFMFLFVFVFMFMFILVSCILVHQQTHCITLHPVRNST